MRYVFAAMLASQLLACTSLPPPTSTCSTSWECEVQAYNRAGH